MPMMEVNLEQLLKVVEKLEPAELAILQEQIHLIQNEKNQKTAQKENISEEPYPLKYCIPPKPGIKKGELKKAFEELREVFSRIPGLKEEVERERAEQGLTKESDVSR